MSFWEDRATQASDAINNELHKAEVSLYYLEDKLKILNDAVKHMRAEQSSEDPYAGKRACPICGGAEHGQHLDEYTVCDTCLQESDNLMPGYKEYLYVMEDGGIFIRKGKTLDVKEWADRYFNREKNKLNRDCHGETPALVVGRRYFIIPEDRYGLLVGSSGGENILEFRLLNEGTGWDEGTVTISNRGVEKHLNLSHDWWAEEAHRKYYINPTTKEVCEIRADWPKQPMRGSGIGRKIESGEIKLYPSRKLAEEANRG